MKGSFRKLGMWEGQNRKKRRARWGQDRDLRISEASDGVRGGDRVWRRSERSRKGWSGEDAAAGGDWVRSLVTWQMRSRRGRV